MSSQLAATRQRRKESRNRNSSDYSASDFATTPGVTDDQEFENDLDYLLTNQQRKKNVEYLETSTTSEVIITDSWGKENITGGNKKPKQQNKFSLDDVTKDMQGLDFSSDSEEDIISEKPQPRNSSSRKKKSKSKVKVSSPTVSQESDKVSENNDIAPKILPTNSLEWSDDESDILIPVKELTPILGSVSNSSERARKRRERKILAKLRNTRVEDEIEVTEVKVASNPQETKAFKITGEVFPEIKSKRRKNKKRPGSKGSNSGAGDKSLKNQTTEENLTKLSTKNMRSKKPKSRDSSNQTGISDDKENHEPAIVDKQNPKHVKRSEEESSIQDSNSKNSELSSFGNVIQDGWGNIGGSNSLANEKNHDDQQFHRGYREHREDRSRSRRDHQEGSSRGSGRGRARGRGSGGRGRGRGRGRIISTN